jgi:O-antigen ligase
MLSGNLGRRNQTLNPVEDKLPLRATAAPRAVSASRGIPGLASEPVPQKPVAVVFPEDTNPMRKLAHYFCLICLFLRFGAVPEVLSALGLGNTYLLYFTLPPAALFLLSSGGVRRTFRSKLPFVFLMFAAWMVVCIPMSTWPGGSFAKVSGYWRNEIIMLFVAAGAATTVKDLRQIFMTLAGAGAFSLITSRYLMKMDQGRISLGFGGTISNSNDLAALFLLAMPFFLFVLLDSKRFFMIRLLTLPCLGYALYMTMGTGSRGALVAMTVGGLFFLLQASMMQRMVTLMMLPMLALPALLLLPAETFDRLSSLFDSSSHQEAAESGASRRYLLEQSIIFTLKNPIWGVGPDQFATAEGSTRRKEGSHGNWHQTHNTWTQISSECGLPGLVLFAIPVLGSLGLVYQVFRQARRRRHKELEALGMCFMMALLMYYVAATFLSIAYQFRFPALLGLATALYFTAQKEWATTQPQQSRS